MSLTRLGGKGSLIKTLKGGDIKESIYLCKFLFESLLWYKVEYLRSTQPECLTLLVHLEKFTKVIIDMMLDKSYMKALPKLSGHMAQWIQHVTEYGVFSTKWQLGRLSRDRF